MEIKIDNRRFLVYWDESYVGGPMSGLLTPADIIDKKGWDEEAREKVLALKLNECYKDSGMVLVRVK